MLLALVAIGVGFINNILGNIEKVEATPEDLGNIEKLKSLRLRKRLPMVPLDQRKNI